MDRGVTFVDTADAYGNGSSERVLGRALRHRRDRAFLATKGGYVFRERTALEGAARRVARYALQLRRDQARSSSSSPARGVGQPGYSAQDFTPNYLRAALEASLRRLNTDYLDLYQLHGPPAVCDDDALSLMFDLRSEGKIGAFGVGLESLIGATDWLETGALSSIQVPFGVLDPLAGDAVIPAARLQGVRVVARAVFAAGFLADRSQGDDELLRPGQPGVREAVRALASSVGVGALQVAAWFVTARPGVGTVLVGTTSTEHLEQSLRYIESEPPDHVVPLLDALVATTAQDDAG
jgi:aryl-alcohol dehydrogenase-like predicted oxidoreductase